MNVYLRIDNILLQKANSDYILQDFAQILGEKNDTSATANISL